MTITIKKTFRNCIISILLLGNISYSEDIPHLKILNDLKKSYEVKYSHFQEKSYYLNYAEELTNDFSGKKKSKVVYDYRSLVESIDKIEDLLKLIEIVDKEIPPLRGLELYPNYFTSELINKYKEWENYYVDKSFFDKGAFYPYGVTLFEGVFGNMYYIDDGSCAPYNYEYWYRTTKSLTLTNKYTQQKVYCTGCRDAKEALPKLWENYRSTKDVKDRKKRILQESIKSKIKLINNDVMKIIEEVNFQLPSLKSDVSLIKQSLLNILTELEKNSVKIKSREIINPKKLTEKIRILKDQIQLVFENYNLSINAENLEDAKYYLYRYNYLTNRTNTIVETKKTEKISFSNKIDFEKINDTNLSTYPLSNRTFFSLLSEYYYNDRWILNYYENQKDDLPENISPGVVQLLWDLPDYALLSYDDFQDIISTLNQNIYSSLYMYEYNLNTIKEFSKDNNNLFGFLSGNTILLIKENKIQYFNIEIVEETNWGSTLYKTIIKPVNNMSDKSLNIRIVKD